MFTRLFMLFATLSFSNTSAQNESVVWETDIMKAVERSTKENKPLFLFFTGSDWCGWCKRLHSEVFSKPEFKEWAQKKVVLVELDFPRSVPIDPQVLQRNRELAQMFGVAGYPTVWFVTATRNGSEISFGKIGSTGYVFGGPAAWLETADKILSTAGK